MGGDGRTARPDGTPAGRSPRARPRARSPGSSAADADRTARRPARDRNVSPPLRAQRSERHLPFGMFRTEAGRPGRRRETSRSASAGGVRRVGELAELAGHQVHRSLADVDRVVADPLEAAGDHDGPQPGLVRRCALAAGPAPRRPPRGSGCQHLVQVGQRLGGGQHRASRTTRSATADHLVRLLGHLAEVILELPARRSSRRISLASAWRCSRTGRPSARDGS